MIPHPSTTAVHPALRSSARGFLVRRLQRAMSITPDGQFGNDTRQAVVNHQRQFMLHPTGLADENFHQALGLPWPGEFERCMNLVQCFEGTGFGDCNATDIDGAGLTLGIAGFTTLHGEVQQLLRQFIEDNPAAVLRALPPATYTRLRELLAGEASAVRWKQLFFENGKTVSPHWVRAFQIWGERDTMQALQMTMAHERFWVRAQSDAASLGYSSVRARCLFLDIAVQNGGWKHRHTLKRRDYSIRKSDPEEHQLLAIALAVAEGAKPRWKTDVLQRKETIARGTGTVHRRSYNLISYGL